MISDYYALIEQNRENRFEMEQSERWDLLHRNADALEALLALNVTNILMGITSDENGDGAEVYATSVKQVDDELNRLNRELSTANARIAELEKAARLIEVAPELYAMLESLQLECEQIMAGGRSVGDFDYENWVLRIGSVLLKARGES